jgi:hypothetical protein
MAFTIPGGQSKGKPLPEADDKTILYWFDRISKDLSDNPDKNYADRDRAWLAGAEAELKARGIEPGQAPANDSSAQRPAQQRPAQQQRPASNGQSAPRNASAGQRTPQTALAQMPSGSILSAHDPNQVNAMLQEAAAEAHLVTPSTVCGALPPGCEVAISYVMVDPNPTKDGPGEVYPVAGGKLGLSGTIIRKIAAAAGVSWDSERSGRLDDGSDPRYCCYRAVGWARNFDGSDRCLIGEVEIDMRDNSAQIEAMKARAKAEANITSQIRDTKLFLLRHAVTKAKLVAIGDLGMKRSYLPKELDKPFRVARLMWTGRTDDPELRRIFAEKTADAMIGATSKLFGSAPATPPRAQLRQVESVQAFAGFAPPPPALAAGGWRVRFDDDLEPIGYEPAPRQAAPRQAPPARPTPRPAPTQNLDDIEQPYGDEVDRGDNPDAY